MVVFNIDITTTMSQNSFFSRFNPFYCIQIAVRTLSKNWIDLSNESRTIQARIQSANESNVSYFSFNTIIIFMANANRCIKSGNNYPNEISITWFIGYTSFFLNTSENITLDIILSASVGRHSIFPFSTQQSFITLPNRHDFPIHAP